MEVVTDKQVSDELHLSTYFDLDLVPNVTLFEYN